MLLQNFHHPVQPVADLSPRRFEFEHDLLWLGHKFEFEGGFHDVPRLDVTEGFGVGVRLFEQLHQLCWCDVLIDQRLDFAIGPLAGREPQLARVTLGDSFHRLNDLPGVEQAVAVLSAQALIDAEDLSIRLLGRREIAQRHRNVAMLAGRNEQVALPRGVGRVGLGQCQQPLTQVGKHWVCPEHGQISAEVPSTSLRIFLSDRNVQRPSQTHQVRGPQLPVVEQRLLRTPMAV